MLYRSDNQTYFDYVTVFKWVDWTYDCLPGLDFILFQNRMPLLSTHLNTFTLESNQNLFDDRFFQQSVD